MIDLDKIVKDLKKNYSSVSIASNIEDPSDYVSTGNYAFDLISDGGVPFGYCVEFLGLSQSGKSLFLHQLIANAQRDYGAIGILLDRENAYTKERGIQLGIDNDKLIRVKSRDIPIIQDAFEFIISTIEKIRAQNKKAYIVIGLDSISAFGKDVDLKKSDQGRKAKAAHEGLREVTTFIDNNTMFLVANQVTFKIGVAFGNPKTSTAGESMKYYSTLRFSLEDRKQIKDASRGEEVVGNWLKVEAIKTRLGPCYRWCYVPHFYKTGIEYMGGYIRLLVDRGYLKAKNVQEFKSFKQGLALLDKEVVDEIKVKEFLEKHPELKFEEYPEYNIKKEDNDKI